VPAGLSAVHHANAEYSSAGDVGQHKEARRNMALLLVGKTVPGHDRR
jgi:hypothetical protein